MNGFQETMLRLVGMPQQTIDEIEKALPEVAALIKMAQDNKPIIDKALALAKKAQPILAEAQALFAEAKPLIDQATPLIDKAWSEIQVVMPAARDVVAFLKAQQTAADRPAPGSQF